MWRPMNQVLTVKIGDYALAGSDVISRQELDDVIGE
jgi:hypothetical protein